MKDTFFALVRSAVLGDRLDGLDKTELTESDLRELYALADKHDLAHLVGHALFRSGRIGPGSPWYLPFQKVQLKAVYRYEQSRHELLKICEALEAAQISHVPLKGAVVRDYYPEPWLRTSCDLDVLVHEADLDRAVQVLTECGWTVKGKKGFHDISLHSAGGAHLELHYNIKEGRESIDRLLEKVWEYADPTEGYRYEYRQRNEYLMFHLLAHMSYHFISGGCGVRSFMDIWILRSTLSYDEAKLQKLCAESKLAVFYEAVQELIDVWFGGGEHTVLTRQLDDYVLGGGVYGSMANRVTMDQAQTGSKMKNLLKRIFMPYEQLKTLYPVLKRNRWLCPVFEVVRWIQILASGRGGHAMHELKLNQKASVQQVQETDALLQSLGLKI